MADDSGLSWGRYCLTCNQHYYEIKSIGKWQCKYHPLPLLRNGEGKLYGLPDGTYACCGTSPSPYLPSGKRNPHFNSLNFRDVAPKIIRLYKSFFQRQIIFRTTHGLKKYELRWIRTSNNFFVATKTLSIKE